LRQPFLLRIRDGFILIFQYRDVEIPISGATGEYVSEAYAAFAIPAHVA
jgi:hypothetical protein